MGCLTIWAASPLSFFFDHLLTPDLLVETALEFPERVKTLPLPGGQIPATRPGAAPTIRAALTQSTALLHSRMQSPVQVGGRPY